MFKEVLALTLSVLAAHSTTASAQASSATDYPTKSIRMVVGFAPGGGTDIIARIAGQGISENLRQQVVIDNRLGAGGNIAVEMVARSAPDGYTLLTTGTGTHAINPSLYSNLRWDPIKDFTPVSLIADTPYLMVVNPSVPARSVKEFIALAKSKPGAINMASSGAGGMPHLAGELFNLMAGTKMLHVPYKGTGAVFPDLIGGRVQVTFGDIVATLPHVKGGRLRALGITSPKRAASLQDIPTIAESGVPGYDAVGWFGVFAPAATPRAVVMKLNGAIVKYVKQPEIERRFTELGAVVVASTPERFAEIHKADLARWAKVVKAAGMRVE